jgi:hypothetical protein
VSTQDVVQAVIPLSGTWPAEQMISKRSDGDV